MRLLFPGVLLSIVAPLAFLLAVGTTVVTIDAHGV